MESKDWELLKQCLELAKQGIDLEKLFEDMKPLFKVAEEIMTLALKNYNFINCGRQKNKYNLYSKTY